MTNTKKKRFRERTEKDTGGLATEPAKKRPSRQGLALDALDVRTETGLLHIESIVDKIMPEDTPGLAIDIAKLDLGVSGLVDAQKAEKVGARLEEAQAFIDQEEFKRALPPIAAAIQVDPKSAQALVLKAHCLSKISLHDEAVKVLQYGRVVVEDPELRILILKRLADCVRASTKALEQKLVEAKQLEEAMKLIDQGLAQQPSNIVFLYHRANLFWLAGDKPRARAALEQGRQHVGRESTALFEDLSRKIEFGDHREAVEAARRVLRDGNSAEALRHLESPAEVLAGNEYFDALLAYAKKRRGAVGILIKSGVRSSPADQQLLRWLLAEELAAGEEALRLRNFDDAIAVFEAAARIDSRCGAVCYHHAHAIYLKYERILKDGRLSNPVAALADLNQARDLAERAAVALALKQASGDLAASITELQKRFS